MDGILLWDKEAGVTSHDVVARVRDDSGERHVGHAGTLDPAATGLLVLCLGRALKVMEFLESHDKAYDVVVRLGRVTDTDDAEGRIVSERDASSIAPEALASVARRFVGEIRQRPPAYSAVKVAGRRLYQYARLGQPVDLPERAVRVYELDLKAFAPPLATFRVRCSKGTYVRSIARDLGAALGCGASVERLRRTESGPFRVEEAVRLFRPEALLPLERGLAHLPEVRLAPEDARRFCQGRGVEASLPGPLARVYEGERLLGVGRERGGKLWPRKVLV